MIKLYHGSYLKIDRIDLSKSRPFKDFGRAFYLSADEQQAWERAYAATALWGGNASVTEYEFDETQSVPGEIGLILSLPTASVRNRPSFMTTILYMAPLPTTMLASRSPCSKEDISARNVSFKS